jgi:hypothetical protein
MRPSFAETVTLVKDDAVREDATAFEMGDHVLEQCPMGEGRANTGALEVLRELSDATGVPYETLRARRSVSARIPHGRRLPSVSWSVYQEIANRREEEQEKLLRMVAEDQPSTPSGRWTVNAVREALGKRGGLRKTDAITVHLDDRLQASTPEEKVEAAELLLRDPDVQQAIAAGPPEADAVRSEPVASAKGALRLAVFVLDARVAAQHYAQAFVDTELDEAGRETEAAAVDTVLRAWERVRLALQTPSGIRLLQEVEDFLADVRA